MDLPLIIYDRGIKSLTRLLQIKALFEDINQWVFALVTESAHVVVHVKGPHHGTSEVTLFQPVNLQTARRRRQKQQLKQMLTLGQQSDSWTNEHVSLKSIRKGQYMRTKEKTTMVLRECDCTYTGAARNCGTASPYLS